MRSRQVLLRGVVISATTAVLAVGVIGSAGAASTARPSQVKPAAGTHYAVTRNVCSAPAPGHAACDSMRRVTVPKGTPGAQPFVVSPNYPVGLAGGYTPADLASAYGYNADAATPGQVVGIVDAYNDPNALADLDTFDAHYGLTADTTSTMEKVGETGSTTSLPANDTSGWSIEESLDLDAVRGVCHTCKIILVETNSTSFTDLAAGDATAHALGATEISNSYGGDESPGAATTEYNEYNFPGTVVTASTGDHGWYDFDYMNENYYSNDVAAVPAALPDVVSVGGTSLYLNPDGTRQSETVWNHNGPGDSLGWDEQFAAGAGGGGCSTVFPAQAWQSSVPGYNNTGCKQAGVDYRLSADVSAIADPYTGYDIYDSYNGGEGVPDWATYGGTSLASPVTAAMWALAGGAGGTAYPALSLYGHLTSSSSPFYDVTSGGNGFCGGDSFTACESASQAELTHYTNPVPTDPNSAGYHSVDCAFHPYPSTDGSEVTDNTQCNAAHGYDGPSGVGTPNGLTGFTAMNPKAKITLPSSLALNKKATFKSTKSSDPFPGGTITKSSWNWGDGSKNSSGSSAKHAYKKAGTYAVKLKVTDTYGQTDSSKTNVTVGEKPKVTINGPSKLKVNKSGSFSGKAKDKNTGGSISKYSWNWGDGSTSKGKKASHTFSKKGTYTVKLTATDNSGLKGKQTMKVKVS
jgi:PKD repeat protein